MKNLYKNKKIQLLLVGVIILVSIILVRPTASATELLFSTTSVKVKTGESFDLDISIDTKGVPSYTTIVELKYPFDLLEVVDFKFAPGLVDVTQPGYDVIDNQVGKIIKTAGFPAGVVDVQKFGTVKFRTIKDGQGSIIVGSDTSTLDENNQDIFSRVFPIAKVVSEKEAKIIAPENIFDIDFEIKSTKMVDANELKSEVKIKNLSKVLTPIYLVYTVIDVNGNEQYKAGDYLSVKEVETSERIFEKLDLPVGIYSLVLTAIYGDDVEKRIERAFVVIEPDGARKFNWMMAITIASGAFIVLLIFIYFLKKKMRKKIYEGNRPSANNT